MIYLILGENTYKAEQELRAIVQAADVSPERLDAASLTENTLADIVRGGSLFSEKRLIVLRQLSNTKSLLDKLAEWSSEVSDDTTLVLLETKLDKRTKAYKTLVKNATMKTAEPLTERDHAMAEEWLRTLARQQHVSLSPAQVKNMVARALVAGDKPTARSIDQMQLARAVAALRSTETVTDDMIATVLPPLAGESVFELLEMAASRQAERAYTLLDELGRTEDAHRTLALIIGQWAQVVSVALAEDAPATVVGTELGMHPFVAKKMQAMARGFSRNDIRLLTTLAADIDAGVKRSHLTPSDGVFRFVHALVVR